MASDIPLFKVFYLSSCVVMIVSFLFSCVIALHLVLDYAHMRSLHPDDNMVIEDIILKASAEYVEVARSKFGEFFQDSSAFVAGCIYIRAENYLFCIGER